MHNERLFKLLHDLLDIAYIYGNDHKKFYAKFIEIVNVKSLSRRKIINPDAILKTSKYNHEFGEMKRSDAEFLALLSTRLSYRALTVVYKLKDRNSVYVKRHRLQERLSKRMKQFLEDIRE